MSTLKKLAVFFIIVLIVFVSLFFNRIYNAYLVYSLVDNVTELLCEGNDKYSIEIFGTLGNNKSLDTLTADISYNANYYFLADVSFKNKNYIVNSNEDSTFVLMNPSNLIVTAKGSDKGNFDAFKLVGEILNDYPQTSKITSLSFFEKLGLTGWGVSNLTFTESSKNNEEFNKISLIKDSNELQLWLNKTNDIHYLIGQLDNRKLELKISISEKQIVVENPKNENTKILRIERDELNEAIYRGALRTGVLLLTKFQAPKVLEKEETYGNGKLIYKNGNRVILAKGTHRELGEIQGALLKNEIRKLVDATLYTMCWVYTEKNKTWFIDDFRAAYKRLLPFIPERYEREMQGMSKTSGISLDEIHLTNVFPALFHCSGFAVFTSATEGGKLYHGRVLDYITELGLQFSSVVYVMSPNGYNSFVNVGYAGFIGSVTGMNEHQVSFGEMGGGGVGDWDGMPMAFLMRDGLEKSNNLSEAVKIFEETPRTCEYYYVIADGKIPDARGLATTPTKFEIINPNQYHEKLNTPVEDAVIMSSGNRYKELVKRIQENYSEIDEEKAIRLMDRPVAMKSDLHNVLFAPQSLELWVANAGVNTPACNEPYTHYNLKELLTELSLLKN